MRDPDPAGECGDSMSGMYTPSTPQEGSNVRRPVRPGYSVRGTHPSPSGSPDAGCRPALGTHVDTPHVGQRVRDTATGQVGLLMDIMSYTDPSGDPHKPRRTEVLAFIRSEVTGREWTTHPENVIGALVPWEPE